MLQKDEQKKFQDLAVKAQTARDQQERRFDQETAYLIRGYDTELETTTRTQKQQVERAEQIQESDLRNASKKIRSEQVHLDIISLPPSCYLLLFFLFFVFYDNRSVSWNCSAMDWSKKRAYWNRNRSCYLRTRGRTCTESSASSRRRNMPIENAPSLITWIRPMMRPCAGSAMGTGKKLPFSNANFCNRNTRCSGNKEKESALNLQ